MTHEPVRLARLSRLAWVDIARGVLVVIVVVGHTVFFMARRGMDVGSVEPAVRLLQEVRIPALFVLSGMLFSQASARAWRTVVRTRVLLLGWLLVVWLLVELVVRGYVLQLQATPTLAQAPRYALGQLALPEDYLWFIWALLVMVVLGRLLARAPLVMTLLFVAMTTGLLSFPDLGRQTDAFVSDAPFFLLGLSSAPWLLRLRQRYLLAAGVPAVVLFVLGAGLRAEERIGPLNMETAATLVSLAGLPVVAGAAVLLARVPGSGGLQYLGRRTLPVYVLHMPVLLLSFAAVRAWGREWADPYPLPTLVLLVVSNVAVCVGVWWVCQRLGVRGLFDLPRWVTRLYDRVWRDPGLPAQRPASFARPGETRVGATPSLKVRTGGTDAHWVSRPLPESSSCPPGQKPGRSPAASQP